MPAQDVCHAYVPPAAAAAADRHSGVWWAPDAARDLSALDASANVCTLRRAEELPRDMYSDDDRKDLPLLQSRVGAFVHAAVAEAALSNLKRQQPPDEGSHDIRDRQPPLATPTATRPTAIVSTRDSHLGHFVEVAGALAEVTAHLRPQQRRRLSPPLPPLELFFPTSAGVPEWTAALSSLLLGPGAHAAAGRSTLPAAACFSVAVFPLGVSHSDAAADDLRAAAAAAAGLPLPPLHRQRAWSGRSALLRTLRRQPLLPLRPPSAAVSVARQGPPQLAAGYCVTLLRREHTRTVANMAGLRSLLVQAFPSLPVVEASLEGAPLLEQAGAMRRTALLVAMHGAGMANVVFLPPGALALELFPLKFAYGTYRRIALRYGVHYLDWHNTAHNASHYANNCLDTSGFAAWTDDKCHRNAACRSCVRDHVVTTVDLAEVRELLEAVAIPLVRNWLMVAPSLHMPVATVSQ
eukprot:SM000142S00515  [mRNA]  locus=s142:136317:138767:+ [translate_table: standard]